MDPLTIRIINTSKQQTPYRLHASAFGTDVPLTVPPAYSHDGKPQVLELPIEDVKAYYGDLLTLVKAGKLQVRLCAGKQAEVLSLDEIAHYFKGTEKEESKAKQESVKPTGQTPQTLYQQQGVQQSAQQQQPTSAKLSTPAYPPASYTPSTQSSETSKKK